MKRPILWVTGSLTAATALAATLLIATATRGNVRPEFQAPVGVGAPIQTPTADCPEAQIDPSGRSSRRIQIEFADLVRTKIYPSLILPPKAATGL